MNEKKLRAAQVINCLTYRGVEKTQKEIDSLVRYGESYFSQIRSVVKPLSDSVLIKLLQLDEGEEKNSLAPWLCCSPRSRKATL